VRRAFEVVRDPATDVPPVVVDALRELAAAKAEIASENAGAAGKAVRVRRVKKARMNGAAIPVAAGSAVGSITEVIQYIFDAGFAHDTTTLGFFKLPAIEGGITAVVTMLVTWVARHSK